MYTQCTIIKCLIHDTDVWNVSDETTFSSLTEQTEHVHVLYFGYLFTNIPNSELVLSYITRIWETKGIYAH